ncbi:MAG: hypothetical protein O2815_07180, partial [Actinomycetota bacterium]|nr:hypothetical protein [Actinomycetota bacterium]
DLARAVRDALQHQVEAQRRAESALDHVRRHHSWAVIAARTVQEYSCDSKAKSSGAWSYDITSPERNLLFDVR